MIVIVGAGPAGAQAAYELAKAGQQVTILEDHKCVGEPVACTGLVTKTILELLPKEELESVLINTLKGVDVIGPKGSKVRIPLHEYVVDRAALDRMLIQKAVDHGAILKTGHRFITRKGDEVIATHAGKEVRIPAHTIIGADGPLSDVAKDAGIYGTHRFYVGLQVTLKGTFDKDVFTTWFGGVAPDFFAWSVPESATLSRVGLATQHRTREHLEAFLKSLPGQIVARQAGPIPLYSQGLRASDPMRNTFLVGDAAGLVKGTTGGGIITGMMSGKLAAEAILEETNYEELLAPLRRELWLHLLLRRALNKFGDADYESLVRLMDDQKVRDILRDNPREYPSRFLLRLLASKPALMRFAPKGFAALVG